MKVKFVLDDWRNRKFRSVYSTKRGIELSIGSLHSGSSFSGTIELDADDAECLADALQDGYHPVFYVVEGDKS